MAVSSLRFQVLGTNGRKAVKLWDRRALAATALLLGVAYLAWVRSGEHQQPGVEERSAATPPTCPGNTASRATAESTALVVASDHGFVNTQLLDAALLTGNELWHQQGVYPDSPSTCYWYIKMTGTNTRTRHPLPPFGVTPGPTPVFSKFHVALNAVSLDLIYSSKRGAVVVTPDLFTREPLSTDAPFLAPRPTPRGLKW